MSLRLASSCALALFASHASAQCQEWTGGFETEGVNGVVYDAISFDDGNGTVLYVAGHLNPLLGLGQHIARFDGEHWSAAGSFNGTVYDLEVYDDGSGPALYAAGGFTQADGQAAIAIAKWNGVAWQALPGTLNAPDTSDGIVGYQMHVFDDGGGAALYVAGNFLYAGTTLVSRLARWNGAAWSSVGGGVNSQIAAFATFDDGTGPALYVAGGFTIAGGVAAYRIAKWNGAWSALDVGLTSPLGVSAWVSDLAVWDDGNGAALYAAGRFEQAGGAPIANLVRWDGTSYSPVATIANATSGTSVENLHVHDDGSGAALWIAGFFSHVDGVAARSIARFDGALWSAAPGELIFAPGVNGTVQTLASWNDGSGPALVVGGDFWLAGGVVRPDLALVRGGEFATVGPDRGVRGVVEALEVFDDGSTVRLYVGGDFEFAAGQTASGIARYDGTTLEPFAQLTGTSPVVHDLLAWDDGSGGALYVAGTFNGVSGGPSSPNVVRWDGTSWSAMGPGLVGSSATVTALAVYDDGAGAALYAAGLFTASGSTSLHHIARWTGTSWVDVGGGAVGTTSPMVPIRALASYDDGTGPQLYAGGKIIGIGGITSFYLARWNGTAWSNVGGGIVGPYETTQVSALHVANFGAGAKLYVGGTFLDAGGTGAQKLAVWDGAWSATAQPLDATVTSVLALSTHDAGDGAGPRLHVGGTATAPAGSAVTNALLRDDGASWTPLDLGSHPWIGTSSSSVMALESHDTNGTGTRDLFVGGSFTRAGTHVSSSLARRAGCGETGTTYCHGDGTASACPCGNTSAPGAREGCLNSLGAGGKLRARGEASLANDTLVFDGSQMPNASALYFQGTTRVNGGSGVVFGAGLRCAGGATLRLLTKMNLDGASSYPQAGDPSVSVKGQVQTPGTRTYQARYRNAFPACVPDLFNLTNAIEIVWQP